MRIATYNVEWFTNLFDKRGELLLDDAWSGRQDVTRAEQLEALAKVFTAMDADAVMVIEAPDDNSKRSTTIALENFAQAFGLRARKALIGFSNHTQQEIALLYDPDVIEARHDPKGGTATREGIPRFDGEFEIDLDVDADLDLIRFSKPPLEVAAKYKDFSFRLIGVHVKSKAPHGARNKAEVMQLSIANRRKQLAQCIWLRARVRAQLQDGEALIVLGDLNDGPGLDEYEKLFGRSGVEIVMGEEEDDATLRLFDPNAYSALSQRIGVGVSTSRFYLAQEKRFLSALLDYVMVSPQIMARRPNWRIWHPFDDPDCYNMPELREALLTASDHFPVTLDFEAIDPDRRS
ncbi:MAG: endonuclease/exonuclease/phosphatase family protein [Brevirhabdus sp.]